MEALEKSSILKKKKGEGCLKLFSIVGKVIISHSERLPPLCMHHMGWRALALCMFSFTGLSKMDREAGFSRA